MPLALTKVPGAQVRHWSQASALTVVLKVPVPQGLQVLSVVAVPQVTRRWPAVHTVHGVQAVAAFASWSQVLGAQVTFGVVPPAQYVPAAQGAQPGAAVGVPAVSCSVPGAHAPWGRHEAWFGVLL